MRRLQICAGKIRPVEFCVAEVSTTEVNSAQLRPSELGPANNGLAKIRSEEVCPAKVAVPVFFYEEPRFPGSGVDSGLVRLAEALNTRWAEAVA